MAVKTVITDYNAYNDSADEIDLRKEGKLAQSTIIDLKEKEVKTEIEKDEDLKQLSDAIDFMESVQKGETVLDRSNNE